MKRLVLILSLFAADCDRTDEFVCEYYLDGTLQAKYTLDARRRMHGERFDYYPSGKLRSVTHYYHGQFGNDSRTYDEEGREILVKE